MPLAAATDAASCAYPAPLLRDVETELTSAYQLTSPKHRLETRFDCHALGEVQAIRFSEGAGHGFSLRLYTFERSAEGFELYGQRYRGGMGRERIETARVTASMADVDAALATVRAALDVRLEEKAPPPTGLGVFGVGTSSHDFHLAITLEGSTHRWGRRFTGYEGGREDQNVYVPLRLGAAALRPLVEKLEWVEETSAAARVSFAAHFLREASHFDDAFNWWVKERYVAMAEPLGTRPLIPSLVERLREGDDRSTQDTTDDALAALEAITGWDGRRRPQQTPHRLDRIASYRAACP